MQGSSPRATAYTVLHVQTYKRTYTVVPSPFPLVPSLLLLRPLAATPATYTLWGPTLHVGTFMKSSQSKHFFLGQQAQNLAVSWNTGADSW